jgi:hypothetical protein
MLHAVRFGNHAYEQVERLVFEKNRNGVCPSLESLVKLFEKLPRTLSCLPARNIEPIPEAVERGAQHLWIHASIEVLRDKAETITPFSGGAG